MTANIRIVDNKKLSMTQQEWDMYEAICRSYDRPNFKGEELFKGLFDSDDDGIIMMLKPPASQFTSMEVFLFVCAIFQHQHMRKMYGQLQTLMTEVRSKLQEVTAVDKNKISK